MMQPSQRWRREFLGPEMFQTGGWCLNPNFGDEKMLFNVRYFNVLSLFRLRGSWSWVFQQPCVHHINSSINDF